MPWYRSKTTKQLLPLSHLYENVQDVLYKDGNQSKELREKILGPDSYISEAPIEFHLLSLHASINELIPLHVFLKMPIQERAKWLAYQNIKNKDTIIGRFDDEMEERKKKEKEKLAAANNKKRAAPKNGRKK